ncbi:hypothetical protein CMI45_00460 [Candidatus Pacearchaeota archaeon]|nr:hypothetical protein [Candidatus Pacearchaeota archaeon]MAG37845.1 hypothetical protein [Candidatus Pacearchaeota archaeon]|tara:strand:+ start:1480 stop:1818 length:339 start_codon:yes stop_codon:yes gene_type:complete
MPSNKFVRISYPEKLYAQKNLLHSELELLISTKYITEYKSLRSKEARLKIALKSRIGECLSLMKQLNKKLPKVKIPESDSLDSPSSQEESPQSDSLDKELARIRSKLERLQE